MLVVLAKAKHVIIWYVHSPARVKISTGYAHDGGILWGRVISLASAGSPKIYELGSRESSLMSSSKAILCLGTEGTDKPAATSPCCLRCMQGCAESMNT